MLALSLVQDSGGDLCATPQASPLCAAGCPRSGLILEAEPEGPSWGSEADPPNGPKARTP